MKILVTGANGFIGTRLIQTLVKDKKFETIAMVRRDLGNLPDQIKTIYTCNMYQTSQLDEELHGIDCAVHLAGVVNLPRNNESLPIDPFNIVNVEATATLARKLAEAGAKRFVFISSIGVNGNNSNGGPFTENDSPNPQDDYSQSKWEAEKRLMEVAEETGMEFVIIRPPLVYGPNAKWSFSSLMKWVAKGVPLPFGSVIDNKRSLVALDNLNDLIIKCIEHPAAANEIFVAGDGEDMSTAELLNRVAIAMNKPSRLIRVPVWMLENIAALLGKRAVANRLLGSLQVDISKANKVLGWQPPISVDEGLQRAVSSYFEK